MSIEICRCGKVVDTDTDDSAYYVDTGDFHEVQLNHALCAACRDDYAGLAALKKDTAKFRQRIFDWVSTVGRTDMLETLRAFEADIDKKIGELNGTSE